MMLQTTPAPVEDPTLKTIFEQFVNGMITAIPQILSGIVFLVLAYLVIKFVLYVTRTLFERIYPVEQGLIVDLSVAVVGIFLWFGAALALLKIVGLGEVATSLGSAAGFIGLGVAFALKEMIADTVAGVYLLRDSDFSEGDRVDTAAVNGTVAGIDLRKTRIRADDGKLTVLANRDVEKKWTKNPSKPSEEPSEEQPVQPDESPDERPQVTSDIRRIARGYTGKSSRPSVRYRDSD